MARKSYRETSDKLVNEQVFGLMRSVAAVWAEEGLAMAIGQLMSDATTQFWREFLKVYEEPPAEVAYQLGAQFAFILIKRLSEAEGATN
jgi:hypothetical protein